MKIIVNAAVLDKKKYQVKKFWRYDLYVPALHLMTSGDRHQLVTALSRNTFIENIWMERISRIDLIKAYKSRPVFHTSLDPTYNSPILAP